jgi:surfeit locus 1 family protein
VPRALRTLLWPTAWTMIAFALLLGLGEWQLERLAWKEDLIAQMSARVGAPPSALPGEAAWAKLRPQDYEYRRARAHGVYDAHAQAYVFQALGTPKGRYGGPGYLVMTPLRLDDGSIVLVNRGFVPQDRRDEPAVQEAAASPVDVVGLMRSSEARTLFTPADDPARGQWFTRDPAAIGMAFGLQRVAPFTIDADAGAPGELPQGGETILSVPNNHLSYALTWFGLAAALIGVFGVFAAGKLRAGA